MTLGTLVPAVITVQCPSRCHVTGAEAESQLIRHRVAVRHGTGDTLRCTAALCPLYSCTVVTTGNVHSGDSYSPGHSRGEKRETHLFGHLFNWVIKEDFYDISTQTNLVVELQFLSVVLSTGQWITITNPDDTSSFLPPPPWLGSPHLTSLGSGSGGIK